MPVILEEPDRALWLGEEEGGSRALLRFSADDILHLWPVSRAVNNVRNNGAELLDEADYPTSASDSLSA